MKKLITILTIMIVLVCSVFADPAPLAQNDSAQIDVTAVITLKKPVFALKAASFGTNGAGTNAVIGVSDTMEHGSVTAEDIRIGDDVLSDYDATVNFQIVQTALSRAQGTYTLTVAASNLVITKIKLADGTESTDAEKLDAANNKFVVSAAPTIQKGTSGTAPTNTTMDNTTAGELAITYDGKKVDANTILGNFSYTWTHDANCAAGTYEADVTLTITSIE